METRLKKGTKVRHYKGAEYTYRGIARNCTDVDGDITHMPHPEKYAGVAYHTETSEPLPIYVANVNDFDFLFISKSDNSHEVVIYVDYLGKWWARPRSGDAGFFEFVSISRFAVIE